MTDRALQLLMNNLDKWYLTDIDKIEALNNSIMNGWLSIYEPNSKNSNERITSKDVTDW
jgi:hypothetical protein